MKGKVNGAVETCKEGEPSFRQMDMFINFSDPMVAERFDAKTCTWAFGMNLFYLHEWRRQNLTAVYHKYQQMVWISCFVGCLCIFLHTIFSTCCASLSQIS